MVMVFRPLPQGGNESVLPCAKEMTRGERREQAARVRRFVALPPQLQEGCLQYAEKIKLGYGK